MDRLTVRKQYLRHHLLRWCSRSTSTVDWIGGKASHITSHMYHITLHPIHIRALIPIKGCHPAIHNGISYTGKMASLCWTNCDAGNADIRWLCWNLYFHTLHWTSAGKRMWWAITRIPAHTRGIGTRSSAVRWRIWTMFSAVFWYFNSGILGYSVACGGFLISIHTDQIRIWPRGFKAAHLLNGTFHRWPLVSGNQA